ncbi:MAG: VOC family protein [Candidatus Binatia bacterium]
MESTRKVHVALHVTDVDRSVAFYRAVFGLAPVK